MAGTSGKSGGKKTTGRAKVKFDEIDLAILNELQTNSKITNAMLSQKVGISPPSTLERVKKLENQGIVTGYVAIVDPDSVGKGITAIVHVTLREHGEERLNAFYDEVVPFEEVQSDLAHRGRGGFHPQGARHGHGAVRGVRRPPAVRRREHRAGSHELLPEHDQGRDRVPLDAVGDKNDG